MERSRTARLLLAAAAGAGLLVSAGGSVSAATAAQPANTTPPSITGTPVEGSVLDGHLGTWSGNPTDYVTWWQRCGPGGDCNRISGTKNQPSYRLVTADAGRKVRFLVGAANADGRTWAASAETAAIAAAQPVNLTPPSISGKPVVGSTLSGTLGKWTGKPTDYNTWWQRCNADGGNCANIAGSGGHSHYFVVAADVGATLRYAVGAANGQGRTWASSAPTPVITAAAPPPKNGCPATSSPDDVAAISPPARLLLDGLEAPSVVTKETTTLILRFHVSSTCNGSVRGALVYVTAVPFFQFANSPEVQTGSDGWATVSMPRLSGFPVSSRQQLIALFVRARKGGEDPLGGISTRRLFSVRVNLHA